MKKLYAKSVKRLAIDMTLSENPLGCSPDVLAILRNIDVEDVFKYPDMETFIAKVSSIFGVSSNNLMVGTGSEQLIKLIVQIFVNQDDTVAIPRSSFDVFSKEAGLKTNNVEFVKIKNLLGAKNRFKLIFLCNPNNPTGEKLDNQFIGAVIQNNPKSLIVIDEATGEFLGNDESFVKKSLGLENVIVLKTVSKVFGGAGLRVGFAFGNRLLIRKLNDSQQAFPISCISAKLALACLKDTEFVRRTKEFIARERNFIRNELEGMGFEVSNSITNNLLITDKGNPGLVKMLADKEVSVVDAKFFPGSRVAGFRVAIRDKVTNRKFLSIVMRLKGGD